MPPPKKLLDEMRDQLINIPPTSEKKGKRERKRRKKQNQEIANKSYLPTHTTSILEEKGEKKKDRKKEERKKTTCSSEFLAHVPTALTKATFRKLPTRANLVLRKLFVEAKATRKKH